jgi:hypothetical protein
MIDMSQVITRKGWANLLKVYGGIATALAIVQAIRAQRHWLVTDENTVRWSFGAIERIIDGIIMRIAPFFIYLGCSAVVAIVVVYTFSFAVFLYFCRTGKESERFDRVMGKVFLHGTLLATFVPAAMWAFGLLTEFGVEESERGWLYRVAGLVSVAALVATIRELESGVSRTGSFISDRDEATECCPDEVEDDETRRPADRVATD